jgi:undecaprenyl-diphosphatase
LNTVEALLLGAIQGLTEFLPVSSSGHRVVVQALMGVAQEGLLFEITVHVATLASVLIFYRKRVAELVLGVLKGQTDALVYAGKLVVATLPAVALVLVAGDFLDAQFERPVTAGFGLIATGFILWTTRRTVETATSEQPSWTAALWIGCAQAFAIIPGVSRSGSTVAAALALGVRPAMAAEFSFMMSVVAIAGAAARSLSDLGAVPADMIAPLALGGAMAMVCGVAAIWLFVRLLRTSGFHYFALYTWLAGALVLAFVD